MFEWLQREISAIKTPRFHIVDGPADAKLREAVLQSELGLPTAYKEFVIKFGNAKLYHRAANDSYQVGVFAGPREATLKNGTRIYYLGFHDGAYVYVKSLTGVDEIPIYEFESGPGQKAAQNFEEWLSKSCARARKEYGKKKWAEILRGTEPFSPEEAEVVEARKQIHWRVLGINESGDHIFEIINLSNRALAVLTLGVRSKDRGLNGAIRLQIAEIGPGQTGVVHADCYKQFRPPSELEVYALPDPEPEDREGYWEFRDM